MKKKWLDAIARAEAEQAARGGPVVVPLFPDEEPMAGTRPGGTSGMSPRWAAAAMGSTAVELTTWNPWQKTVSKVFPLSCLPPTLARWAKVRAEETGADVNAFAVGALQVTSGALDHGTRLMPKQHESFKVRPTMWLMGVADPAAKKSIVTREVQAALSWAQSEFAKMRQSQVAALIQTGTSEKDAEMSVPPARRLISSDGTPEKLSDILSRQDFWPHHSTRRDRGLAVRHGQVWQGRRSRISGWRRTTAGRS